MSVHELRPTPDVIELHDLPALALRLHEAESTIHQRKVWAISALYETVGKDMAAKGQRTRTDRKAGVRYHLDPPRERQYCGCHYTLLYQCPTPIAERPPDIVRLDARPSFYITALKDVDD
jgi:hypothetical protein